MTIPDQRIHWFLENACPDHHVRGPSDHNEALHTAMRMLEHTPELARHSFITAVVCGDLAAVERSLAERPSLAKEKPLGDTHRGGVGGSGDRYYHKLGPKGWDPLLFLTHTRLRLPAVEQNAVAIARLLLDHGADPNAHFMAGDSRYTPLVGVIGEGEEDRPPHQRRDELTRLLLERGAEPYDTQVNYNIHFHGRVLWFFELVHEFSLKRGRASDWDDPSLDTPFPIGGYGPGGFFWLMVAVKQDDAALAKWLLARGASPNLTARDPRYKGRTLHAEAVRDGHLDMAEFLLENGAADSGEKVDPYWEFARAAMRLDRDTARAMAAKNPAFLRRTEALFRTTQNGRDRADVAELLLDLGVSPDVENEEQERPLHMAAYGDAVGVGRLLIERGAAIDPVEKNWGNSPLDAAIYSQSKRMIALLGRHSRDPYRLAYAGQTERLRELLAEEPALARTKTEGTLVMWLPPESDERAAAQVQLLLDHGADANAKDASGNTAADYAEKQELTQTAAILRKAMTTDSSLRSE